jgi:hypothetical protein
MAVGMNRPVRKPALTMDSIHVKFLTLISSHNGSQATEGVEQSIAYCWVNPFADGPSRTGDGGRGACAGNFF